MQVLVMSAVFFSICLTLSKQLISVRSLQKKVHKKEEVFSELEGINARVYACLNDKGFPQAGSCSAGPAVTTCIMDGVTGEFGGTYPECHVKISVLR